MRPQCHHPRGTRPGFQTHSACLANEERQATRTPGSIPELRELEISLAAQEALTGNKSIAELRKDTQTCLRSVTQLQRRLKELQKTRPVAAPAPAFTEPRPSGSGTRP